MSDTSYWQYFWQAGPVVKAIMVLLLALSVTSWTFIIQRIQFMRQTRAALSDFHEQFWSGVELTKLYTICQGQKNLNGLYNIFHAGFKEFIRTGQKQNIHPKYMIEGVERSMRIASAQEDTQLQKHLQFLGTVGSTSPYIGLLGTVWGIMNSLHTLGDATHTTINMVAPGIAEALVATAMGLFAAIPAVIAYNKFSSQVNDIQAQYDVFQEEFASVMMRHYEAEHSAT